MSPIFSSARSSPALRAAYQDRKFRPSHISVRMDALARPRCTCSHSRYSLHTDWQKRFSWTGWRWLGWPSFLYEAQQRMDSGPGNRFPSRRWRVAAALTELPSGVLEIAGHLIRPCRVYGNVPPRQVLKKLLGAPAVVVNDDRIEPPLSEKRPELIDQSAAVVWHRNLLAKLR